MPHVAQERMPGIIDIGDVIIAQQVNIKVVIVITIITVYIVQL